MRPSPGVMVLQKRVRSDAQSCATVRAAPCAFSRLAESVSVKVAATPSMINKGI